MRTGRNESTPSTRPLTQVYRAYSRSISEAIAAHGDLATRHQDVRSMRAAKREILRLLSTFVEKCGEPEAPPRLVAESFVPPLLEPVLEDYAQAVPAARDSDALLLLATTIDKLRELVSEQVPRVLEAVFEPTLRMITTNFEDFPEHRLAFFKLLKATNTHCFAALFAIPPEHHKLVVDSVVWAFKHTERTVAETGLEILHELLLNVSQVPDAAKQPFYRAFVLPLIQDVLAVMTDRLHKSGFKMHATLLRHLFHLVEAGHVTVPLFDGGNYPTNQAFMREHVANLLKCASVSESMRHRRGASTAPPTPFFSCRSSFPNLTHQQVVDFVVGCFDLRMDLPSFKTHLRDFLVQLKEFSAENNQDLYSEEQQQQQQQLAAAAEAQRLAVPGLVNPNDRPMDDDEDL